MKHVVQMSSGVASAYVAQLVVDRYGRDDVIALFADVARDGGEWWEGEDPDNYRFLSDVIGVIDIDLVTVKDGRGVWGLAEEMNMIPNNRAPFCSRVLKHEPCRAWLDANCDPEDTILYVGIDLSEAHRCENITERWSPYVVEYPLMWKPLKLKTDAMDWCRKIGVSPPRMYSEGFQHANCAGACVRMGNGAAEHLLRERPAVFKALEAREEAMRGRLGDVAMLVDRRGLTPGDSRRPFPLSALRSEIEEREATQPRLFDDMGCGRCFD